MKEQFEAYLIRMGYKQVTPSGHPSTVYDYIKRIDHVCKWEDMSWQKLAENIGTVVPQYDTGGPKEEAGNRSHKSVINALKRFADFVNE